MDITNQLFWNQYAEQLCDGSAFNSINPEEEMIVYLEDAVHVNITNIDQKSSRYNLFSRGSIIPDWSLSYNRLDYLPGKYGVFMGYLQECDYPDPRLPKKIRSAASKFNSMNEVFLELDSEYKKKWLEFKTEVPMITRDQFDKEYGSYYRKVSNFYEEITRHYISLINQKAYAEHLYLLNNFARVSAFSGGACSLESNNELNLPKTYSPRGVDRSDPEIKDLLQSGNKKSALEFFVPSFNIPQLGIIYNAWLEDVENERTSVVPINIAWDDCMMGNVGRDSIKSVCTVNPGRFLSVIGVDSEGRFFSKSTFYQENFNIKFTFNGLFAFIFQSSGWFNKGFCQDSNNTKWVFCPDLEAEIPKNLDSGMYGKNPVFFSENGSLITMPKKLIMGYEPFVELTLNEYDYSEIKTIYDSAECAIIRCGPFTTRSMPANKSEDYNEKSEEYNEIEFDDKTSVIKIRPISFKMPMLLGFICRKV